MSVRGYLVFVPSENIASMAYGDNGALDKVTVATTPGHLAGPFEVVEVRKNQAETCPAAGAWEGGPVRCDHPSGHKALLDHFDRGRGLRWARADGGKVTAWPDTENETWALGGRRWRRELHEYTDRNGGLMSPAARQELEEMRAEDAVAADTVRPARLSADLTMSDGRTVHVPVVTPAGPASAGRIWVAIPYPASAMPGLVISAAVTNEELGVAFRSGFQHMHAQAGDTLTVEFGDESLDAEALAKILGERPDG